MRCAAPTLFHGPVREMRHTALVRRYGMTVMRMLFTVWIGLDYLSSLLSHREPSSPNSLDLCITRNSHARVRATRRAGTRCVKHKACPSMYQAGHPLKYSALWWTIILIGSKYPRRTWRNRAQFSTFLFWVFVLCATSPFQAFCGGPHRPFFTCRCVRCAAPVRRCRMTVMRMLCTIWLGLDYLSLELSHIKPSSPNWVDLHTS